MNIPQNLALFSSLIQCGSPVYLWTYDATGELLSSNCPDEALFHTAFSVMGIRDQMLSHGQTHSSPLLLGCAINLCWGAAFEKENDTLIRCHVIGPIFLSSVSYAEMEYGFRQYSHLELSMEWSHQFFRKLSHVPLLQHMLLARYTLMLHYCITGDSLHPNDLSVINLDNDKPLENTRKDRYHIWHTEQAMLQMVRNGDLDYKTALNASINSSNGVPVQGKDPLRQGKTSNIVFISLVCRAAMEGGLSPESAYALGDYYIQSTESASTLNDLGSIAMTMYDDFVHRVHDSRQNPAYSEQIRKCCDYIHIHLNEKLRAADLASLVGYTEYYLTYKFKAETGSSLVDYIRRAKLERATLLLTTTTEDILSISEKLGFTSRSYFTRVFTEAYGCTPTAFRKAHVNGLNATTTPD